MKRIIKNFIFGKKGLVTIRMGIARGIKMDLDPQHSTQVILGLAEAEIARLFVRCANEIDYFFDIGAASGYYSLVFRKFNRKAKMFLFDFNSSFLEVQRTNLAVNGMDFNFSQYDQFVSDVLDAQHISIDGLMRDQSIEQGNLLFKVDVDGGEMSVLRGMKNTLQHLCCRLIIETHSQELEEQCMEYLSTMGYKTHIISNAWWRIFIPEHRPIPHNRWLYAFRGV